MTDDLFPEEKNTTPAEETMEFVEWATFLADQPPAHGDGKFISNGMSRDKLERPDISLYCESSQCSKKMNFRENGGYSYTVHSYVTYIHLHYICRNCEATRKTISVAVWTYDKNEEEIMRAVKLGEHPAFRPHVSKRLLKSLTKVEIELFKNGCRSENQGLGIGAFGYYRQVVDKSKKRFLEKVIEVAKLENLSGDDITALEALRSETSFKRFFESIEGLIPSSLLIHGHNPFTALYKTLSDGLHDGDDKDCLGRAKNIRLVLEAFAARLDEMLKEDSELKSVISSLGVLNSVPRKIKKTQAILPQVAVANINESDSKITISQP